MRLILLHGWGASGDDLLPLGQALVATGGWPVAAVTMRCLEAPQAHPAGGAARQWYDLQQPGWPDQPQAVELLKQRLEQELAEAGDDPVVVLGFSQGAAMALDAALELPVAAVIACSGYPHPQWRPGSGPLAPLLLLHGRQDAVVPVAALVEISQRVREAGGEVRELVLEAEHTIPAAAVAAAAAFLLELGIKP